MDDRNAAAHGGIDHIGGTAGTARVLAIPHRDQQLALGDRRVAHAHIGKVAKRALGRQFPYRFGAREQRIEFGARSAFEIPGIFGACERQHRMQGIILRERSLGRDLIGAFGQRRQQRECRHHLGEDIGMRGADRADLVRDAGEQRVERGAQRRAGCGVEQPVTGDA
jgi:hypothetical protein